MKKNNSHKFCVVLASDEKYLLYLEIAVKSIRNHNSSVPIKIFSCSSINFLKAIEERKVEKIQLKPPKGLNKNFGSVSAYNHSLTRIAKLESMIGAKSENILYLDSDVVALSDVEKIYKDLGSAHKNSVYLLLRRPQKISLLDITWLYFKNSSQMSPKNMTQLINDTFSTHFSVKEVMNFKCWNGGVVFGNRSAVMTLAKKWKENYLKMITGKNRSLFIPNDQLCLWVSAHQLEKSLQIKELPLAWNFMPGHAAENLVKKPNPSPEEIKTSLKGVNILHLAQNKTDMWAQVLINEINSR